MERPAVSVVILSRGDRPDELAAAIESVRAQRDVVTEIVVVWNGVAVPVDADPHGRHVAALRNLGIPEGRNLGAAETTAPLLCFLDDDATLGSSDVLDRVVDRFGREPSLAVVCPRIVDETGATAQRHVPRVGTAGTMRAGPVTTFLGGASVVRRVAFDEAGGWEGALFYSMEETDLAWRLADNGWTIWYEPTAVVRHPRTSPGRHDDAVRRTARNRLWIAHRNLPAVVAAAYLLVWLLITTLRDPRQVKTVLAGYLTGWRTRIGPRRPIAWRAVWRLTRLGRPPIV